MRGCLLYLRVLCFILFTVFVLLSCASSPPGRPTNLWESAHTEEMQKELDSLINEGDEAFRQSAHHNALKNWNNALKLAGKLKDRRTVGSLLNKIGMLYQKLGLYKKSLACYEESLKIFRAIPDKKGEGKLLTNMGIFYRNTGQYENALEYFEQALAIDIELKDKISESADMSNIGVVYGNLGQHQESLKNYKNALKIDEKLKDRGNIGSDWMNIGVAYRNMEDLENARKAYEEALKIFQQIRDKNREAKTLLNLGVVYQKSGDHDMAITLYREALGMFQKTNDRRSEGGTLSNIADLYTEQKENDNALEYYEKSLKICQKGDFQEEMWRLQSGLGKVKARLKKYKQAVEHYDKALNTIKAMRSGLADADFRKSFMRNKFVVYDEFIELLNTLHQEHPSEKYDEKSFEIFERKQGRIFIEQVAKIGARHPTGHPEPISLQELQKKILRPDELMLIYGVMEKMTCLWVIGKSIFKLYPIYNADERGLEEKVKNFREGLLEQVIEVIAARKGLTRRRFDRELTRGIRSSMKQIRENGHRLHNLLIPEKVRAAISDAKMLYIIPTSSLYNLPFEALVPQNHSQNLRYLIEDAPIAYLSSASLLKTLRKSQKKRNGDSRYPFLAFANPIYDNKTVPPKETRLAKLSSDAYYKFMGKFEEIPLTEFEAEEAKEILGAPDEPQSVYLRQDASRSKVFDLNKEGRLDDYQYVLFSCHGILPDKINQIIQPALVMSRPDPKTKDSGFLMMADVLELKFNADLITLSACNTGKENKEGKVQRGEGVGGFTRAFITAGTSAVAVTLWPVMTGSSRILTTGVYQNLKDKKTAKALQEIKLRMIKGCIENKDIREKEKKRYRHPFYWAPMVIFGEGN